MTSVKSGLLLRARQYFLASVGLVVLNCVTAISAQEPLSDTSSPDASGLRLGAIQVVSQIPPRPGCWWAMPASVSNQSDETRRAALVATIRTQPRAEYRHQLTLLPGEIRQEEIMVKIPESAAPGSVVVIDVSLRHLHQGSESVVRAPGLPIVQRIPVKLGVDPVVTALLPHTAPPNPAEWEWRSYGVDESYELAVAARLAVNLPRSMVIFRRRALPSDPRRWEGIDSVIINSDRWLDDLASVAALRRWLMEGGKVWISLDQLNPQRLEALLGDVWLYRVIDEVELNQFELSSSVIPELATKPRVVERERPVSLVRITQQGGEVTHRVDGWPAAIRIPVGEGTIWVTTLGATGWLGQIDESKGRVGLQRFHAEPWFLPIAGDLFYVQDQIEPEFLNAAVAASFVGYSVPSRGLVIGMLAFAFVTTAAVGMMMLKRERLEWMGLIAPLILAASASPLIWVAERKRQQVPESVGRIQLARPQPGSGHTIVKEMDTLYVTEEGPIEMKVPLGATIEPFPNLVAAPLHRIADGDDQMVSLHVGNWPVGIRGLITEFHRPTDEMEAVGRFSEEGVTFELPSSLPSDPEDPIYVGSATRHASLQKIGRREFLMPAALAEIDAPLRLRSDNLISADVVRHGRAYEELLEMEKTNKRLASPSIFCFTRAWESALRTNRRLPAKGEAMNQLAIRFAVAEPGTAVSVPAVLLAPQCPDKFRSDGLVHQFAHDQEHIPSSREKSWHLEWHLPQALLPLNLEHVELSLEMQANGWAVDVGSGPGEPWAHYESPSGEIVITPDIDQVEYSPWDGVVNTHFEVRKLSPVSRSERSVSSENEVSESPEAQDRSSNAESDQPPRWRLRRPRLRVSGTVAERIPAS